MNSLIITGGIFPEEKLLDYYIEKASLVIGVDGAADRLIERNIVPDILIGDFDTADPRNVNLLLIKGAKIIRLDPVKNISDTEAAVDYAISAGATDITILGATGLRTDHTFSNIMIMLHAIMAGVPCSMVDEYCEMTAAQGKILLSGSEGQTVSILTLTGELTVNAKGLKYQMNSLKLLWGSSRGLSNVMLSDSAELNIEGGYALIIKSLR